MNTKMKIGIFASVMLIVSLAAVALSGTYYVGDTGARLAALELDGDLNAMGNTITNASIYDSNATLTNLTATRAIVTDGSGIAAISGTNIASGTVADARIASTIARYNYTADIDTTDLVISLNFETLSASTDGKYVFDSSGNNRHLRLYANLTNGKLDLNLSNSSARKFARINSSFQYGRENYSTVILKGVLAYGNATGSSANRLITFGTTDKSNYRYTHIVMNNASNKLTVQFRSNDGTIRYSSSTAQILSKTIPHDIVMTRTPTQIKLYFDGDLSVTTNTVTYPHWTSADSDIIIGGTGPSGGHFNGTIDSVIVYKRVLSDTEIKAISKNTIKPPISFVTQKDLTVQGNKMGIMTGKTFCWDNVYDCKCNTTFNVTNRVRIDDCS